MRGLPLSGLTLLAAGAFALASCGMPQAVDAPPAGAPAQEGAGAPSAADLVTLIGRAYAPLIGTVAPEGEALRRVEPRGDVLALAFQFPFFDGRYTAAGEQEIFNRFGHLFLRDNCGGTSIPLLFSRGGRVVLTSLTYSSCEGIR
jgi:hypothetical protein